MTHLQQNQAAATLLRVALGIMFLAHAGLKLFVFTPAGTAGYFASLGLPQALAYATIGAELVAAVALLGGIAVRATSLAMIPLMLGTIVFVHGANGWSFANEGGGWEYPAFLTVALAVQALLGSGAYAFTRRTPRAAAAAA
ncbi:MAG: DoxX family protein [Pseudomonadota bacterium]